MGEWVDIPLATQEGYDKSTYVSAASLVNLMLVPNRPGSPRPFAIRNTPALINPVGSGAGAIMRGIIQHGSYVWYVKGTELYRYDGSTATLVGTVSGTLQCQMVGAGTNQIVIVDGTNEYVATTGSVTAIVPPAGSYSDVTYQDGYTIFVRDGTDEFYVSALDDPTTISALDFSAADAVSDTLVGCISDHRELVLFGTKHIEFWYNSGSADFPFARSSPGVAEIGCFARGSIAKYDNAIFFLGSDKRVYRLEGYRPTPVSTQAVDDFISTLAYGQNDVFGSVHIEDGRPQYVLSVGVGHFFLDIATGLWHRRSHSQVFGVHYLHGFVNLARTNNTFKTYCALSSGNGLILDVFEVSSSSYRDNGGSTDTTRTMTCPAVDGEGRRLFDGELLIEAERVSGNAVVKYSDNGGTSYVTHSTVSLDQDYPVATRLGSFRRRIYQLAITANARVAINALRARRGAGAS